MNTDYNKPLSDGEFVELGELLASMPEPFESMEPDRMDGFLTAVACMPENIPPSVWMPYVFDDNGNAEAGLAEPREQMRLEDLVYRRMRMIEATLRQCLPIDPIFYEAEDDRGRPLKGHDAIAALEPFAAGFWEAMNLWEGLRDSDNDLINSALLGILRHLPEDLLGDLAVVKEDLDFESPLENLKEALADLAESVAEIVSVTRGFKLQQERSTSLHRRSTRHP